MDLKKKKKMTGDIDAGTTTHIRFDEKDRADLWFRDRAQSGDPVLMTATYTNDGLTYEFGDSQTAANFRSWMKLGDTYTPPPKDLTEPLSVVSVSPGDHGKYRTWCRSSCLDTYCVIVYSGGATYVFRDGDDGEKFHRSFPETRVNGAPVFRVEKV